MVSGRAAQRPITKEPTREEKKQAFQIQTLTGDIRDEILREFKAMSSPWAKMKESEQERLIHRAEDMAFTLVDRAVDIMASRGFDFTQVRVGEFKSKEGMGVLECSFSMPCTGDSIEQLKAMAGPKRVLMIVRGAEEFAGERAEAKPDVVGDLRMPAPESVDPQTGEVPHS